MNYDNKIALGLIQQTRSNNIAYNLEASIQAIKKATDQGAQIICLQELFRSQYFCQNEEASKFKLAETIPGPTTEALSKLAAELKIVLVAPLFEKRAQGIYHNSAVVIDVDGSISGCYRKMHIPDDPCFYEKFYFN